MSEYIEKQLHPGVQTVSITDAYGNKMTRDQIRDKVLSVQEADQLLFSDCDECLSTKDVGEIHFYRYFSNPENFVIKDPRVLKRVLIPEYFEKLLPLIHMDLVTPFLSAVHLTTDAYMRVVHEPNQTNILNFKKQFKALDDLTFRLEPALYDMGINFNHPSSERPLLIRVRAFHGQTQENLQKSYTGFDIPKSEVYEILKDIKPWIITTNLQDLIVANFEEYAAKQADGTPHIYGSTYHTSPDGTFSYKLNDTCYKFGKVVNPLVQNGIEVSDAPDAIGLMCGDSTANDLPAMIEALKGDSGYAIVRIKGEGQEIFHRARWTSKFQAKGISQSTIANRVIFVDDRFAA